MKKRIVLCLSLCLALCLLSGCVDQKKGGTSAIGDGGENEMRIVATSVAVVQMMERLDVELVGVPHSDAYALPERYQEVTQVGPPMGPDMEVLTSIHPTLVLSPNSLEMDLLPKYDAAGLTSKFLNLRSVDGMFDSIRELGELLDRNVEADALIADYEAFMESYRERNEGWEAPRVLILMGLPGSYVVATEESYVGSLVKMAGGRNVYAGETEEFINANVEDMAQKDADVILRTVHAMPEEVMDMFAKEFLENDVWKHFRAVKEGQVHDLPVGQFGMSASFQYKEALLHLEALFYGEGG